MYMSCVLEAIEQIKSIKAQLERCLETSGYHAMEAMFADIASVDSDCGSAQKGGKVILYYKIW